MVTNTKIYKSKISSSTMERETGYDPEDLAPHAGIVYKTKHRYGLDRDGKFRGMGVLGGAKALMLAGLEEEFYSEAKTYCRQEPGHKERLDDLILNHGKAPAVGLRLVVSLTPGSARNFHSNGMVTSPIMNLQ